MTMTSLTSLTSLTSTSTSLPGQLEPRSDAGGKLAAAVDELAPRFAERNRRRDREGEPSLDSLAELRALGYLRAAVPVELGGLGVDTVHDLGVVASRLARADASLAIGVNMHTVTIHTAVQVWRAAVDGGDDVRAARLAATLRALASSGAVVAAAVSEPGGAQDLSRPATTATPVGDGGWRIDGTKAFCTLSPAADLLTVAVTFRDGLGEERYGFALVPTTAKGCVGHDDWDALGMRASGSGRVSFDGVRIKAHDLTDSHPAGETDVAALQRFLTSGLFHASATLGIAEEAHRLVVVDIDDAARSRLAARGQSLQQVADNVVDLAAMRATFARSASATDDHFRSARGSDTPPALATAAAAFADVQATKSFIDRTGPRVVDRALDLSGGAGYLTHHPLSQHYRDVRAGAFMHPLGTNRALDFIAQVALHRTPEIR